MAEPIHARIVVTQEVAKAADFTIEGDLLDDFIAYFGRPDGYEASDVLNFIRDHRDRDEIEDSLWSLGVEIAHPTATFAEIESVTIQ